MYFVPIKVKRLVIKKSIAIEFLKSYAGRKLEYFKRELLEVLERQEKEEQSEISKAFIVNELYKSMTDPFYNCMVKGGKVGAVGEIRIWNGKKYKKMPNKKWVRIYDTHDRHTEISIARLKGKIKRTQSVGELFDIVMNNIHRFSDADGKPLDIVLELKKEVDVREKIFNAGKKTVKDVLNAKRHIGSDNGKIGTKPPKDEVKHDGEYVLTKDGKKDFGEISPELAKIIKRQAGKIRLRIGEEHGKDSNNNYGERHIERKERLKQIRAAGFDNARDFIEYVCNNFDTIYGNGIGLIIAVKGERNSKIAMIQLTPNPDGNFYDVKTGLISRNTYFKDKGKDGEEKRPLWSKTESGLNADNIGEHRSPLQKEVPRAISGQSDIPNIVHNETDVNKSVKVEVKDFPEQFNKGKWKKQTKILLDFINSKNGDYVVKSLYKKLGTLKNNLPFKIAKAEKKYANGSFSVSCNRATMKPEEQTLHILEVSNENEYIKKASCMKALHEIMHMIDFSCRDNKNSPDYASNNNDQLINAIKNAKVDGDEIKSLESHFAGYRVKEREIISNLNAKNKKIRELGNMYNSNEITYSEYCDNYRILKAEWEAEEKKIKNLRAKEIEISQYCDILDALSCGRLYDEKSIPGHGKYYYRKESNRVNEIIANYGVLLACGSKYAGLLKKNYPEIAVSAYNLYRKFLDR